MNFAALKQELSDRGFARVVDARLGLLVNEARQLLDNLYPWPYREASSTGAVPLTITDLGTIQQVTDTTTGNVLTPASSQQITEATTTPTAAGTPRWYTVSAGNTITTYPVSAGQIKVAYYKRSAALTLAGDTPLAPTDYHMLIVDLAEREAHRTKGDYAAAAATDQIIAGKLARMTADLFANQAATGPETAPTITDASCDW